MNLSVDLTKHSIEYSTGDVLIWYAIIIAVVATILITTYKTAVKKNPPKDKK